MIMILASIVVVFALYFIENKISKRISMELLSASIYDILMKSEIYPEFHKYQNTVECVLSLFPICKYDVSAERTTFKSYCRVVERKVYISSANSFENLIVILHELGHSLQSKMATAFYCINKIEYIIMTIMLSYGFNSIIAIMYTIIVFGITMYLEVDASSWAIREFKRISPEIKNFDERIEKRCFNILKNAFYTHLLNGVSAVILSIVISLLI